MEGGIGGVDEIGSGVDVGGGTKGFGVGVEGGLAEGGIGGVNGTGSGVDAGGATKGFGFGIEGLGDVEDGGPFVV